MSNTQKLVVTRTTTIELTTADGDVPMLNLEGAGRQMIEGGVQETQLEIEANGNVEAELSSNEDAATFESMIDVDNHVQTVIEGAVAEGLDNVDFGVDIFPWERENVTRDKED